MTDPLEKVKAQILVNKAFYKKNFSFFLYFPINQEMKAIQKKTLILLLSFSNLAVLSAVFYTYFDSSHSLLLFSSSGNSQKLRRKIKEECRQSLDELMKGERSTFICRVSIQQRHKGASYVLRTRVEVRKDGDNFVFSAKGAMRDKTQHATEADFCNDCDEQEETVEAKNLQDVMNQVTDMAESYYYKAKDSVQEAQEKYNKKDREKRIARVKERDCKGRWDEESEEFEEFDVEGRLQCRMKQISNLNLPVEVENFYHGKLKKELWQTALSDEAYILDDVLGQFGENPYRYPLSVRSSANLLQSYLGWKEQFGILDGSEQKTVFVNSLRKEINQMLGLMKDDQAQREIYYLNQGFEGILAKLNQVTNSLDSRRTTPALIQTPTINYDDVRKQTDSL